MAYELSPKQRKFLSGMAHSLSPVVQVGAAGLTESVFAAVAEALRRHELIKVKLPKVDSAAERHALYDTLIEGSEALRVALLGRVAVIYKPRGKDLPDKPRIQLP